MSYTVNWNRSRVAGYYRCSLSIPLRGTGRPLNNFVTAKGGRGGGEETCIAFDLNYCAVNKEDYGSGGGRVYTWNLLFAATLVLFLIALLGPIFYNRTRG